MTRNKSDKNIFIYSSIRIHANRVLCEKFTIHNQGQRKQYTGGRGMLVTYSTYKGLSFIHKMLLQISRKKDRKMEKGHKWSSHDNLAHDNILFSFKRTRQNA